MDKPIQNIRHEIIEGAIEIEDIIDENILLSFGLEDQGDGEGIKEIFRFKKYFLERMSLEKKFGIIQDIIEDDMHKKIPEWFGKDCKKFREIRNEFSHKTLKIDFVRNKEEVTKSYEEYTQIYNKLKEFLMETFYMPIDEHFSK